MQAIFSASVAEVVHLLLAGALAGSLVYSGVAKLMSPSSFLTALPAYALPLAATPAVARLVL
jgi:hypothetical protein